MNHISALLNSPITTVCIQAAVPVIATKAIHIFLDSVLPRVSEASTKKRQYKIYTIDFLVWVGSTALVGSIALLPAYQALMISSAAMISILIVNIAYKIGVFHSKQFIPQQIFENPYLLHYLVKNFSEEEDFETQIENLESFISLNKTIKSVTDQVRFLILKEHPEVLLMDYFDTFDQMLQFAKKHNILHFNLSDSNIQDEDLKKLAAALPNITYLDVSNNHHLNSQSIDIIIGFKFLRYLDVNGFNLLDEHVSKLAKNLKNLETSS